MLRIIENDLILFKYLLEENYIHIDDIFNYDLLSQKCSSNKRRRLSNLKKAGYIKYKGDPGSYKNFVFATRKAINMYDIKFKELKEKVKMRSNSYIKYYKPDKYSIKKDIDLNTYVHDRKLTQLRFILEKLGVDYWERETMYYNKYNKNPDALFELPAGKFAVELERTYKSEERYKKIFKKYSEIKKINIDYIIYITLDNSLYEQMDKTINKAFDSTIKDRDWKEKYRLSKYDDFEKGLFKLYNPTKNKYSDLTDTLKKYSKSKKG